MNWLYAALAGLLLGAAGAWYVEGMRWDADVANIRKTAADEVAANAARTQAQLIAGWAETETIRQVLIDYKRGAQIEMDRLQRGVGDGSVRLRVAATCAAPAVLAPGAVPGGAGSGTTELDAFARPTYYALRTGLSEQYALLNFCRSELRKRSTK